MWPGLALGLYTTGTVALCLHKCYLRYAPVCRIRYSNIYEWFMLVFAHCIWWNNLKHSSSVCVCVWQMIKRNYDYDELSMQLQHGAISFVSVCVCCCTPWYETNANYAPTTRRTTTTIYVFYQSWHRAYECESMPCPIDLLTISADDCNCNVAWLCCTTVQ